MSLLVCTPLWGEATMTLGEYIDACLESNGLNQRQFADRTSGLLNQSDISKFKNGQRPTPEKLRALADAMDVPYNRLAVMVGYADAEQIPLSASAMPHEQMLADLLEMAQARPDLLRTITELRRENTEETYRQAIAIVWRHMISGLETARDLLAPEPSTAKK